MLNYRSQILSAYLSLARIIATAGIFLFHVYSLLGIDNKGIDTASISIFCFLSGYLSFGIQDNPSTWLCKRTIKLMIPYWIIITPVILINRVISFKEATLLSDIMAFLGFNLFVKNPIYLISWYITFVLLLYVFLFIFFIQNKTWLRVIIWLAGLLFFCLILKMKYYFISFSFGLFFMIMTGRPNTTISHKDYINRFLFTLQGKCFCFFLVHGGILAFLRYELGASKVSLFYWGLALSSLSALCLQMISQPLVRIVTKHVLALLDRSWVERKQIRS